MRHTVLIFGRDSGAQVDDPGLAGLERVVILVIPDARVDKAMPGPSANVGSLGSSGSARRAGIALGHRPALVRQGWTYRAEEMNTGQYAPELVHTWPSHSTTTPLPASADSKVSNAMPLFQVDPE